MEWHVILALLIAIAVTVIYSQVLRFMLKKSMTPIEYVLLAGTVFVCSLVLDIFV